ncbi:hypothetical protein EKD04_008715 [Chloroflexales bacterium ZM16-3]|nr:hypothetical protein [Chloroflexales bacterium ZM16-3]
MGPLRPGDYRAEGLRGPVGHLAAAELRHGQGGHVVARHSGLLATGQPGLELVEQGK